jgi:hypothetical protein
MTLNFKKIIPWVILGIIVIALGGWLIYRYTAEKSLQLTSPQGGEVWRANDTYKITWKARNMGRVGIILLEGPQGRDVKWIAQDVPARRGSFDWQIFVWEESRQDYKIAIFEYPWKEGNLIDYSDDFFTVVGPQFASCDALSVAAEWPFMPSDFPDLRKVFITQKSYTGNLERLEGADRICQQEAQEKGLTGAWKALLGDDTVFVIDRLNLGGIFVMADSGGLLPENKTCHRLLGNNFNDFLKKLSESLALNRGKFDEDFLEDLQNVWLGRLSKESLRECTTVEGTPLRLLEQKYSFTTTCQNWTTGLNRVPGYPPAPGAAVEFPVCFTPGGVRTNAVGLAGLSLGILGQGAQQTLTTSLGQSCDLPQKLLCVQQ